MNLIGNFGFKSGRDINKFEGIDCRTGTTGVPIVLNSALAFSELELINQMDMGSHTMFVGKVINGDILSNKASMIEGGIKATQAYGKEIAALL